MATARSLWKKPQKELAELLDVNQNAFEKFFSTAKEKALKGNFGIADLKPYVSVEHYPALEQFLADALARKSPISYPPK